MRFRADNRFQTKRVSTYWDIVLTAAAKDTRFRLNSGRRTKGEQLDLVRQKGVWSPSNPTGAAAYSPTAPHIRVGRQDHAIDVDTNYGEGEGGLQLWLEQHGATVRNPITQEPWHMEVEEADLRRLAAQVLQPDAEPVLAKGKVYPDAVKKLQRYLRALSFKSVTVNGKYDLATRIAIKRFQRKHKIATDSRATVGPKTWRKLREAVR